MRLAAVTLAGGRRLHGLRLPLALLAAVGLAAPAVRAPSPSIVCAPGGDLTVELGEGMPLPLEFNNPTDFTVTFYVMDLAPDLFDFLDLSPLTDPRYGTIVVAPHSSRTIPNHAFPIP